MNKNLTAISFVLFVCLMACSNKKEQSENISENDQITLIFENIPSEWHSEATGCMVTSEIEYVDDNFIKQQFIPDETKQYDTLVVNTEREVVEFTHNYKTLDKFSYLFQKGDSVIIQYQDNTPVATVINRKTKTYDSNFELYKREQITPNDYPAYIKYKFPMSFADYSGGFIGADEKVANLAKDKFYVEKTQEKELLDSLEKNGLISENIANYYVTQTLYQQKILQLQEKLGARSIQQIFYNLSPENFYLQFNFDRELGWLNNVNILDSENDSLLYFSNYYELTDWIYNNYLSRKVGREKSITYVDNNPVKGSNVADYISLNDTIIESKLLSPFLKDILLFKNIQNIIENNSVEVAKRAFNKFEEEVKDPALINYIRNKYLLDTDTSLITNDFKD